MSIWPNWTSRSPMRQHLLDHDLIDVSSANARMTFGGGTRPPGGKQSRHGNRSRDRSWALRASSSRLRGGAVVVSDPIRFCAAAVTWSTARLNAASFARDGRVDPLSFLTN